MLSFMDFVVIFFLCECWMEFNYTFLLPSLHTVVVVVDVAASGLSIFFTIGRILIVFNFDVLFTQALDFSWFCCEFILTDFLILNFLLKVWLLKLKKSFTKSSKKSRWQEINGKQFYYSKCLMTCNPRDATAKIKLLPSSMFSTKTNEPSSSSWDIIAVKNENKNIKNFAIL